MSEAKSIPKPVMRGLMVSHVKKHLAIMVAVTLSVGAFYKFGITEPRKRQYETFFKNYDPEAALKVMNEAGLMQSYVKK